MENIKEVIIKDEYGEKKKVSKEELKEIQNDKSKKLEKLNEDEYSQKIKLEG
jgi:hypothetical protein